VLSIARPVFRQPRAIQLVPSLGVTAGPSDDSAIEVAGFVCTGIGAG
jgi:hypothetical protein